MAKNHTMTRVGHDRTWQVKCLCGWRSPLTTEPECAMSEYVHNADVQRMRSALSRGKQMTVAGLNAELAWYTERSKDPANSPEEQALWKQLAKELGGRIHEGSVEQATLW